MLNGLLGEPRYVYPHYLPKVSFTWFVMVGGCVTFFVGMLFPTPGGVVESAQRRAEEHPLE